MGILDKSKQIQYIDVIAIRAVITYENVRVSRKEGALFGLAAVRDWRLARDKS